MLDGYVELDADGFVKHYMVCVVPPQGALPAPDAASPEELFSSAYWKDESGWHVLGPQPTKAHRLDRKLKAWAEIPNEELVAAEWEKARGQRNHLIAKSDWTQLPDVPLATKEVWAIYRQALRDITLQPDPASIVWPVPPSTS